MKTLFLSLALLTLAARAEARHLKVGEAVTVLVHAPQYYNSTQVEMSHGESYRFEPNPSSFWIDLIIVTDAEGFSSASQPQLPLLVAYEPYRRMRDSNWFALIGALGRAQNTSFEIGAGGTFEIVGNGEFTPYANDVPWKYGNNWGYLQVKITRVK